MFTALGSPPHLGKKFDRKRKTILFSISYGGEHAYVCNVVKLERARSAHASQCQIQTKIGDAESGVPKQELVYALKSELVDKISFGDEIEIYLRKFPLYFRREKPRRIS